jgi:catechol 2,3-dioxygenase-like lactoylglutathione lyase family enzyme
LEVAVLGLDHVQVAIPTGSEEVARGFYRDLLGLVEVAKPEPIRARGGLWFRAGEQELHLGVEEPFAPARKAHPGLVVDDFEELRARLASAGHEPALDDAIPGVRRLFVHDPFGNRLELRSV